MFRIRLTSFVPAVFLAAVLTGCCCSHGNPPECTSSCSSEKPESRTSFELVRENRAACSIVLPDGAPKAVAEAVENFNETLKTITGTALPTVKESPEGNRIVLEIHPVKSLKTADNFLVDFPDGRTMRIGGTDVSIQWAFNHIIREFAHAEWLMPENCGLSYAPMKDLAVPVEKIEVKDISWPVSRIHSLRTGWWMSNMRLGIRADHDLTLHAFPLEKYGKDNSWPEAMMPVLNGKKITSLPNPDRPRQFWQPCYSNPETAKIAVKNIREYLEKHPEIIGISLGANDNCGHCECPECLKMDNGDRNNRSESYYTFINRVMEELCKTHPDLTVSVLAYLNTFKPPSFKLHPNVVVHLTLDFNGCVLPWVMERQKKVISDWSEKASALGVWDYSWGYPYPMPRLYLPYHLDMLKYVHEHNGKAYYGESWTVDGFEGPKQYLIAKLLWDSRQDMKKLEAEWYVRCVGEKAAPYLKAYFQVWNDYFTGKVRSTPWFKSAPDVFMTYNDVSCVYALEESDIRAADEAMKQVVALAESDQEKQRADVMMRLWRQTLIRLRLVGAGVCDCSGLIHTPEQACKLLEIVLKSPEYIREYNEISERLAQEKVIRPFYLSKPYMRSGGTPVNRNFDAAVSSHLQSAAEFADQPRVNELMRRISVERKLPSSVRALAGLLSDPASHENLLKDGDAENGVTPVFSARSIRYYVKDDKEELVTLSASEKFAASGKKSFELDLESHNIVFRVNASGLKPGKKYVFSFKAFIEKPSGEGYLQVWCGGSDSGVHIRRGLTPFKLSGGVWQSFTLLSPVLPEDKLYIRIYLRNYFKGEKVYLDDLKIMEVEEEV